MNRQDILNLWNVDKKLGLIADPGKFQGEMLYTPYFYDSMLNGFADEDIDGTAFFVINDHDRKEFPELKETDFGAALSVNDVGFVHTAILNKLEYESLLSELSNMQDSIEDE
jgi:hypothetical protein